jgi:hypothetical protein
VSRLLAATTIEADRTAAAALIVPRPAMSVAYHFAARSFAGILFGAAGLKADALLSTTLRPAASGWTAAGA